MPPPSHELHCTLPSSCCEQDINKKINASSRVAFDAAAPLEKISLLRLLLPRRTTHQILHCLCNQAFLIQQLIVGLDPVFWVAYTRLELELCPTSLTLTILSRRRQTPRYSLGRICPCPPHSFFIKCCMAGCCSSRHLLSFCHCRIVPADEAAETATWSVIGMVQAQAWVGQKLLNVTF